MTLHAFNSDIQFANPLTLGLGDVVVVGSNGYVYGQGRLFSSVEDRIRISVAGTIATSSTETAILLGVEGDQSTETHLVVTATGMIHGLNALQVFGGSCRVDNAGTIFGSLLFNGGTSGYGNLIQNSGTIAGADYGIIGYAYQTTEIWVHNSGVISAAFYAIIFSDLQKFADRVVNSGLISGAISLGGGSDLYDGRRGSVIGTIGGGAGDDLFRPGADEDIFDGGTGSDTLDFRGGGGAVVIALDNSFDAGGWAEGDYWLAIENVTGSRGNDRIGGDSLSNRLNGLAGADSLAGQAGNDTVEGGEGIDTLAGGSGNDSFVFRRPTQGGDAITDFSSSAAGNDDRIMVSASGFGAGLTVGTLTASRFQSRGDNLAQDADDRFILRSSDKTLWFDADGNGAGAAVLIADLQANATMTAADIVIF